MCGGVSSLKRAAPPKSITNMSGRPWRSKCTARPQSAGLSPASVNAAEVLPELEAILRAGGSQSDGIHWIGPEGKSWSEVYEPVRGMAAYYNVLHPQVQESMLAVIRELEKRE